MVPKINPISTLDNSDDEYSLEEYLKILNNYTIEDDEEASEDDYDYEEEDEDDEEDE